MLGCFVPCHGCIDNAIHSAAGMQLREECAEIMNKQGHGEPTGKAKITGGYNLPCKHVIHTVGPIIRGPLTQYDCQMLRSCYDSCLTLAEEHHLESIAFCCISTGEYHFPNDKAAAIAVEAVGDFLEHSVLKRVIINVFKDEDLKLYERILSDGLEK
jgi:O-acetyl-ADP-ribose deacetylase (regulator of RNase III)